MTAAPNSYDALPYLDRAFVSAHPDRLATVAALHGLPAPPVEACTVLDIGCGVGGNLLPIAAALPHARLLGIDLSPRQIDLARQTADACGLTNVEFRCADLLDFSPSEGPFDYILCHGVYSWVPRVVQDRILTLCRDGLSDRGLAVVSYNAYPGWHAGSAVRDALRLGAAGETEPLRQVAAGLAFLQFLADSLFEPDGPYGTALRLASQTLPRECPGYVFHEYLEECNTPLHFRDFAARLHAASLRFLDDASLHDPSHQLAPPARAKLQGLADDRTRCEELLDLLRNRAFRSDVLCRAAAPARDWIEGDTARSLLFHAAAEPLGPAPDGAGEQFRSPQGLTLTTSDPALTTALRALHDERPRMLSFPELAARVRRATGTVDETHLARALAGCGTGTLIDLHAHAPAIAHAPPQRPRATTLARRQAMGPGPVVTLRHRSVDLSPLSRRTLALLDGTRDRAELAEAILNQNSADNRAPDTPALTPQNVHPALEETLTALARYSLLCADR